MPSALLIVIEENQAKFRLDNLAQVSIYHPLPVLPTPASNILSLVTEIYTSIIEKATILNAFAGDAVIGAVAVAIVLVSVSVSRLGSDRDTDIVIEHKLRTRDLRLSRSRRGAHQPHNGGRDRGGHGGWGWGWA